MQRASQKNRSKDLSSFKRFRGRTIIRRINVLFLLIATFGCAHYDSGKQKEVAGPSFEVIIDGHEVDNENIKSDKKNEQEIEEVKPEKKEAPVLKTTKKGIWLRSDIKNIPCSLGALKSLSRKYKDFSSLFSTGMALVPMLLFEKYSSWNKVEWELYQIYREKSANSEAYYKEKLINKITELFPGKSLEDASKPIVVLGDGIREQGLISEIFINDLSDWKDKDLSVNGEEVLRRYSIDELYILGAHKENLLKNEKIKSLVLKTIDAPFFSQVKTCHNQVKEYFKGLK